MALSRAQHEANKANGAYHIDRHGNRVTNGAIVIHTQRLKSDPGGNLLS